MTEREAIAKLSEMLPRLHAWRLEIERIEKAPAKERSEPYPPASETEIASAEAKRKFKFPPSYRAFLKLHNGWRNISYNWSACGVSGPGAAPLEKAWPRACAAFEQRCLKKGGGYLEDLRSRSKSDPGVMFWPDHVPCAAESTGGFRVFDRHRPLTDGEFSIAEVGRDEEAINRLPDFIGFVQRAIDIMRRELKEHGRNPDAIAPIPPGGTGDVRPAARGSASGAAGRAGRTRPRGTGKGARSRTRG